MESVEQTLLIMRVEVLFRIRFIFPFNTLTLLVHIGICPSHEWTAQNVWRYLPTSTSYVPPWLVRLTWLVLSRILVVHASSQGHFANVHFIVEGRLGILDEPSCHSHSSRTTLNFDQFCFSTEYTEVGRFDSSFLILDRGSCSIHVFIMSPLDSNIPMIFSSPGPRNWRLGDFCDAGFSHLFSVCSVQRDHRRIPLRYAPGDGGR